MTVQVFIPYTSKFRLFFYCLANIYLNSETHGLCLTIHICVFQSVLVSVYISVSVCVSVYTHEDINMFSKFVKNWLSL